MSKSYPPIVIGVLADLSGPEPQPPLPRLKDRRFVTVTADSLPRLLEHVQPGAGDLLRRSPTAPGPELDLVAAWRGLEFLVRRLSDCPGIKVKVLDVSKKALHHELRRAPGFDDSALFKKVYDEEFATFGGEPYACLIADFSFGDSSLGPSRGLDADLAEKLSQVCSAAAAPLLAGLAPGFLDLGTWSDLDPDLDVRWFTDGDGSGVDWPSRGFADLSSSSDAASVYLFRSSFRELDADTGGAPDVPLGGAWLAAWLIGRWLHRNYAAPSTGPDPLVAIPTIRIDPAMEDGLVDRLSPLGVNRIGPVDGDQDDPLSAWSSLRGNGGQKLQPLLVFQRMLHSLRAMMRQWRYGDWYSPLEERTSRWLEDYKSDLAGRPEVHWMVAAARVENGRLVNPPFTTRLWPPVPAPPAPVTAIDACMLVHWPPPASEWKAAAPGLVSLIAEIAERLQGYRLRPDPEGWSLLDPEPLLAMLHGALTDRRGRLYRLGRYVAVSRNRSAVLRALLPVPAGFAGLVWKLEALEETGRLGPLSPLDRDAAFSELAAWTAPAGVPQWLGEALTDLQQVIDSVGTADFDSDVCASALRAVDRGIADAVGGTLGDPLFRHFEATSRAIRCVSEVSDGLYQASLRVVTTDWGTPYEHDRAGEVAPPWWHLVVEADAHRDPSLWHVPGTIGCFLADVRWALAPGNEVALPKLAAQADAAGRLLVISLERIDEPQPVPVRNVEHELRRYPNVVLVEGEFETRAVYRSPGTRMTRFSFDEPAATGPRASMAFQLLKAMAPATADLGFTTPDRSPVPSEPSDHWQARQRVVKRAAERLGCRAAPWGSGLAVYAPEPLRAVTGGESAHGS